MFCPQCGVENLNKARYCFKCGAFIQQVAPESAADQEPVLKESSAKIKKKYVFEPGSINRKLDKNFFLPVLLIAYLLALIGFVYGRSVSVSDPVLSGALYIVAFLALLYAVFIISLFVYRMWTLIEGQGARTTPGKAVGFLFIPFFNLYWVFQAFWGFAKDYNQYLQNESPEAPQLQENIFLAVSIMLAISPLFFFTFELVIAYLVISFFMFAYMAASVASSVNMLAGSLSEDPEAAEAVDNQLSVKTFTGEPVLICATLAALLLIGAFTTSFLLPRGQYGINEVSLPDQAVYGEDVIIAIDAANTGNAEGFFDLTIYIDDQEIETRNVSLEANSNQIVNFKLDDEFVPGSYNFRLGLGSAKDIYEEYDANFRILKPAEFTLSNFKVEPWQIDIVQAASVVVDVANVGEVEGNYSLPLKIDGVVIDEVNVNLGGGERTKVHFDYEPEEPGLFSVALNGFNETLEVFQIERPSNGTVFTNEISGGVNQFYVENNLNRDVVVVLANPDDPLTTLLAVYVHADSSTTIRRIRNGEYAMFYCHGEDWDSHSKRFTRNPDHNKFEETQRIYPPSSQYYRFWVKFGVVGEVSDVPTTRKLDSASFPDI